MAPTNDHEEDALAAKAAPAERSKNSVPKRLTRANSGSAASRPFMSMAVPMPASDHCPKIASAIVRAGSAMRSSGTIEPANSSWGITASGIRLMACSWEVTRLETSSPMPTAAKPVTISSPAP